MNEMKWKENGDSDNGNGGKTLSDVSLKEDRPIKSFDDSPNVTMY